MRIGLCHKDIGMVSRGGVARLYKSLAINLRNLGVDVVVISSRADWSPQGIAIVTVGPEENKIAYSQKIAQILPTLNPDIAECSTWGFELLAYLRSEMRLTKVVVRGDLTAATLGASSYSTLEAELLERADSVVCVSQFARDDIQRQYGITTPYVVHNGVESGTFKVHQKIPTELTTGYRLLVGERGYKRISLVDNPLPPPSGGLNVVWVGKPTVMKGFDLLQEIIARADPAIKLYLCLGHSPEMVKITVGANPQVTLLQDLSQADYVALLNSADAYLCTSRWEGFGLAPLEAMACGCPVVFWEKCAVLGEFIRDGKDGYSFNTVEGCLEALKTAAESEMGLAAAQQAKCFSWETNAVRTLEIYQEVLGK